MVHVIYFEVMLDRGVPVGKVVFLDETTPSLVDQYLHGGAKEEDEEKECGLRLI